MNEQCKFINSKGYRCGSYAFNLYKEQIDQGDRCDHHYWREQAMKAAAHEREECAVIAETPISGEQDDITMEAKDRVAKAIRARGTT